MPRTARPPVSHFISSGVKVTTPASAAWAITLHDSTAAAHRNKIVGLMFMVDPVESAGLQDLHVAKSAPHPAPDLKCKKALAWRAFLFWIWLRGLDLNQRPLGY